MKIQEINIELLTPYENNQKKHPRKQIEQVAKSIQEFGFNQPIVVDEKNVLIVGHGRLEAAKILGMKKVPVMKLNLTEAQAKAYRIADNKLNESDWDMKLVIDELKELNESESVNFISAATEAGFLFKQTLVWVKSSLVLGRQDYQWQHEPILYGWKPGGAHKWYGAFDKTTVIDEEMTDKELNAMSKKELIAIVNDIRNTAKTDIIRVGKPSKSELHPTTKPTKLMKQLIINSSMRGDIVYDPFSSSGATLMACEESGRKARVMELDPVYARVDYYTWK